MLQKINFKQPKYIIPIIVFLAVNFGVYNIVSLFDNDDEKVQVATNQINSNLPEAHVEKTKDKLNEMQNRYFSDRAYSAIGSIEREESEKEALSQDYTNEQLDSIIAAEAQSAAERKEIEEMKRMLAESSYRPAPRTHVSSSGYTNNYDVPIDEEYEQDQDELELYDIQRKAILRQKAIEASLGINQPDPEEISRKHREDSLRTVREQEREANRPLMVIKSPDTNYSKFNTVTSETASVEASLIKAMIDKTTKAHEGTRLRFKLLDDVSIHGVSLPKGSYLYGTVTGFSQQRVKAAITNILVGGKFLKVNLQVYDNDGMEGFYVPESAFRDFMKDAGSQTVQQNMNFDSNSSSSEISGQAVALQALQNIYNSATSAISNNIRKNRANIKYNTIVYLINSNDAK